ncbi:MAG: YdeI/OmpD-associated family protein [Pseudomonadota bacterium]
MSYFSHAFEAPLTHHEVGSKRYQYVVVYVPDDVAGVLPLSEFPRLRIEGEINDQPFEAALNPAGGVWYLMVPKGVREATGLGLGDIADVRFRVGDQDHVDVPVELRDALAGDARACAAWDVLTPGKKRGWAHLAGKPKRQETRHRKAAVVVEALRDGRDIRDI